jgi:hypothetical protein
MDLIELASDYAVICGHLFGVNDLDESELNGFS